MLILSRKPGTSIVIDDDIQIFVLAITAGSVKVGVEAPPHVAVHRHEVHQKIKAARNARKPGELNAKTRKGLYKRTVARIKREQERLTELGVDCAVWIYGVPLGTAVGMSPLTTVELNEAMGIPPPVMLSETPPCVLRSFALSVELHKKNQEQDHG